MNFCDELMINFRIYKLLKYIILEISNYYLHMYFFYVFDTQMSKIILFSIKTFSFKNKIFFC